MIETILLIIGVVVAIIAALISYWQFRLKKSARRTGLYDKRYPVFLATMQYIASICEKARVTQEDLLIFLRDSKDKEFLFGKDVQQFLEELYHKGLDLKRYISMQESRGITEEKRLKSIDEETQLLEWFSKQFDVSKRLFGEYLKIDKK